MNKNLYQPVNAEIIDIIEESPTIKSFVVQPRENFKFDTGQFVELTLPGAGERLLRLLHHHRKLIKWKLRL